jgi:hypothetical protein
MWKIDKMHQSLPLAGQTGVRGDCGTAIAGSRLMLCFSPRRA